MIDRFIRVANKNEDCIHKLYDSGDDQQVKELFYELDEGFAELERVEGILLQHLHDWVLRQSWVVVDDADGLASTDWLLRAIANPHDDRMATRLRRHHGKTTVH